MHFSIWYTTKIVVIVCFGAIHDVSSIPDNAEPSEKQIIEPDSSFTFVDPTPDVDIDESTRKKILKCQDDSLFDYGPFTEYFTNISKKFLLFEWPFARCFMKVCHMELLDAGFTYHTQDQNYMKVILQRMPKKMIPDSFVESSFPIKYWTDCKLNNNTDIGVDRTVITWCITQAMFAELDLYNLTPEVSDMKAHSFSGIGKLSSLVNRYYSNHIDDIVIPNRKQWCNVQVCIAEIMDFRFPQAELSPEESELLEKLDFVPHYLKYLKEDNFEDYSVVNTKITKRVHGPKRQADRSEPNQSSTSDRSRITKTGLLIENSIENWCKSFFNEIISKYNSGETKNNSLKRYPDGRPLRRSARVAENNMKIEEKKTDKGKNQ